jgi:hypothetical protein
MTKFKSKKKSDYPICYSETSDFTSFRVKLMEINLKI